MYIYFSLLFPNSIMCHPSSARENKRFKFKSFPSFSPERSLFSICFATTWMKELESIRSNLRVGDHTREYRCANTADTGKQSGIYRGFFKSIVEKKGRSITGRIKRESSPEFEYLSRIIDFVRISIFLSFFSNRFEKIRTTREMLHAAHSFFRPDSRGSTMRTIERGWEAMVGNGGKVTEWWNA